MAFQRPFLISLKRSDSSQKWGFGIKGGKDYGEPLTIQTVAEDSLAERFGLHEGDEIIQVGRVNVQDLPLGQVYELLARCGNKIEMFIVREDLLSPRKGKEPGVIKAVVHNPYNSPLSLYSTENIADTLAKQTEVLTEGQFSGEEDEGPENLSFKEKSAVFKLLEEQANQEGSIKSTSRVAPQNSVQKPKVAPPPPPKPKPPPEEHLYNGYDSHHQTYQDQQRTSSRVEYQTTQKVSNQYQYQQEQPVQYQQSSVYQVSSQQRSPGYHSPSLDQYPSPGYSSPISQYQQHPGYQSATNYQQSQQVSYQQNNYQHSPQSNYQQYQTPPKPISPQPVNQQYSPTVVQQQQPLKQVTYQQNKAQNQQSRDQKQQSLLQQTQQQQIQQQTQRQSQQQQRQQINQQQSNQQQQRQQTNYYQQSPAQETPTAVSKAEFKVRPAPPPRNVSRKEDSDTMAAVYKQQYEQHLQQVNEQHQLLMNNIEEDDKPRAHIVNGNIFEHNSTSGTPITYKAPPVAPPKPHWPPPPSSADSRLHAESVSPTGMDVSSVWPPRRSTTTELPRTGFDPAALRAGQGQGNGRRCVWPPPGDEMRSGRNTPQSPVTGRKIQWNPSPSPPQSRRNLFSPSHSPARRKDIQWPPPSPTSNFDKENGYRQSPRLSRKARFDDYVKEHASINVPQTYRPPPGTQHVEFY